MPILRNSQWAEDSWVHLGDDDPMPASGAITVSFKRFEAEREAILARTDPLGLRLKSDERAQTIGHDVTYFALVMLEMPICFDGRAFSTARLLRERYGYKGELRAFGHILPDQVLFLQRCGVNSFALKPEVRREPFLAASHEFTVAYQNLRSAGGIAPPLQLRSHMFALAHAAE